MLLEFASIARLWWALLAIPVILLFILKVRLRRKSVATLLFWDQLFQEQPPRAWWQRLRNLMALMLQLAFIAFVVGALVDPLWSWQRRDARQIVYVIDNSASMQAMDEGESQARLDRAADVASRIVGTLRQRDTAAIITAGGQPRVAMGMTGDVRILKEAISAIAASDSPTRLPDAVELAQRLFTKEENTEVVVLTDGAAADLETLAETKNVTLYGFGSEETGNVAITSFQVRRSVADATSFQVLVEVTNFGAEEARCRLELDLEGSVVDVVPLKLEPEKPYRRTLDHTSSAGGRLIAKLDIEDALKVDNQAVAVLPYRKPIPVLLVTPGSLFLQSVFESIPGVVLTQTEELPSRVPPGTITVIHNTEIKTVPKGAVIVIEPQSDCDLWKINGQINEPIVAGQSESPLLAHIRLQNVILAGAKSLEFSTAEESGDAIISLIQSPLETAMYSQIKRSGGDVLVLSASLADGDLPLRIAFPVLIKNAIEHFLGNKGELRAAIQTGELAMIADSPNTEIREIQSPQETQGESAEELAESGTATDEASADVKDRVAEEASAPETPADLVVKRPDGSTSPISDTSEGISIGPLDKTGVWLVGSEGKVSAESVDLSDDEIVSLAVNLSNPAESDLRTRGPVQPPPLASAVWGGHSLWFYLSLIAILGISVEWFLYHRRIVA